MEAGVAVVVRVDGVLQPVEALPADLGARLVGRLKALADLPTLCEDLPLEGRIPEARTSVGRSLRVEAHPTRFGERVSVHLDAA